MAPSGVLLRLTSRPEPARPLFLAMAAALVWLFGAGLVYWLVTGETRASFTPLGALVFLGPLFLAMGLWVVGDVGPTRALWRAPTTVEVDGNALRCRLGDGPVRTIPLDDIGGVSSSGRGIAQATTVYGRDGTVLAVIHGALRAGRRGPETELGPELASLWPHLFELVGDAWSAYRGCVRRDAGGAGSSG